MKPTDFKTLTAIYDRPAPAKDNEWVLGLDIGYSGIKGFCSNRISCFPSYAHKIPDNQVILREPSPNDIRSRDESGTWVVGELAYEEVHTSDVMDSESELFGRHRSYSSLFRVISRVGLALGYSANQYGSPQGKQFIVQAGLPPKYLNDDAQDVREAISGHHNFQLQIGQNPWKEYIFDLSKSDIHFMPQPLGALLSASIGKDGVKVSDAQKFFSKNVIVFDPGFGTLDDYFIRNGRVIGSGETFQNLGMREVFSRTCKDIKNLHGITISIPELQTKLETGEIRVVDRKRMKSKKYSISGILEKNCNNVGIEAMEKMKSVHNYFEDTDILVAAGGTYEAWKHIISDTFADMEDIEIVPANINDPSLSNVFSIARGYYFYRLNKGV